MLKRLCRQRLHHDRARVPPSPPVSVVQPSGARLTQLLICSLHSFLSYDTAKVTRQGSIRRKLIVVVSYTWDGSSFKPERSGGVFLHAYRAQDGINRPVQWDFAQLQAIIILGNRT